MSHGRVDGKTQNVTRNYSWLAAFKNATTLDCGDAINQLLLLDGVQTSQGAAATQEGFFFLQNKRSTADREAMGKPGGLVHFRQIPESHG